MKSLARNLILSVIALGTFTLQTVKADMIDLYMMGVLPSIVGQNEPSDFNLTLDVNVTTITGDWRVLSSGGNPNLEARVMQQGLYGTCTITDDIIDYLSTQESTYTDICLLEVTDRKSTFEVNVTINRLFWKEVVAGRDHTVAIKSNGTIWSWGENSYGQLGNGTTEDSLTPVQENTKSSDWIFIGAGRGHTLAIKSDRTLWVWGRNDFGQLGDGTTEDSSIPKQEYTKASNWKFVVTKTIHTVALKTDGTLWAWGHNGYGQLGDGTKIRREVPTQENTKANNWSSIGTGFYHTMAIKTDGTLWAWGGNHDGQLGDGTTGDKTIPTQEHTKSNNWSYTTGGYSHTIAIKTDGTLWAWGHNGYGQLGDGTTGNKLVPTQESIKETNWHSGSCGWKHTLATKTDGTLWAWGLNSNGQLGDGTTENKSVPTREATNSVNWASVSAIETHSIARKNDGTLWAWGAQYTSEPKRILPRE